MPVPLRLTIWLVFVLPGIAQENSFAGYPVRIEGHWVEVKSGRELQVSEQLRLDSGVRMAKDSSSGSITIRMPGCSKDRQLTCSGSTSCDQTYWLKDLECVRPERGSAIEAMVSALQHFLAGDAGENVATAITMSRAGDSGEGAANLPEMRDAVLLADNGMLDPTPLLGSIPAGKFWLEFCRSGPALDADCDEAPRIPLTVTPDRTPEPMSFTGAIGLYRVRLWKMSPRGPQATDRSAIALIGPSGSYLEIQKRFAPIAAAAAAMDQHDPYVRLMTGAWILENRR